MAAATGITLQLKEFARTRISQTSLRGSMDRLSKTMFFAVISVLPVACSAADGKPTVLTGKAAFTDAAHQSPGTRRHLTAADLPAPSPQESVDNGPDVVPRPANAWPQAPKGFKVDLYASGLDNPRLMRTAPNGDIFLAESQSGKIRV